MMSWILVIITAVLVNGDIPGDKLDGNSLPGWYYYPLPSAHYSGYIEVNATNGKHLHYWSVRSTLKHVHAVHESLLII